MRGVFVLTLLVCLGLAEKIAFSHTLITMGTQCYTEFIDENMQGILCFD